MRHLSVDDRLAALRIMIAAMFHDHIDVDRLTPTAKQELRAGIDAALVLYDYLKR